MDESKAMVRPTTGTRKKGAHHWPRKRPRAKYHVALDQLFGSALDRHELVSSIRRLADVAKSDAEIADELGLDRASMREALADRR